MIRKYQENIIWQNSVNEMSQPNNNPLPNNKTNKTIDGLGQSKAEVEQYLEITVVSLGIDPKTDIENHNPVIRKLQKSRINER